MSTTVTQGWDELIERATALGFKVEPEHAAAGPGREVNGPIDDRWHTEERARIDAISDRIYGGHP